MQGPSVVLKHLFRVRRIGGGVLTALDRRHTNRFRARPVSMRAVIDLGPRSENVGPSKKKDGPPWYRQCHKYPPGRSGDMRSARPFTNYVANVTPHPPTMLIDGEADMAHAPICAEQ